MDTSDAVYRDLVEQQQDLIVKISLEGRLLFVNTTYAELLGKTKDDLTGSVFMPVSGERYSDVIATQMTKLFRPPFTCIVEQWLQTQKGMRCISWSIKSVLDEKGAPVALVATGRDVTPVKNEQKALRKRDEELMLLIESGNQMYYTHTPDHRTMYISPRIRSLLKCTNGSKKKVWTDYLTDNPVNAAGLERTLRAVSTGKREPPYRLEMETGRREQDLDRGERNPGGEEREDHCVSRLPCGCHGEDARGGGSCRGRDPVQGGPSEGAPCRRPIAAEGYPLDLFPGRRCGRRVGISLKRAGFSFCAL